MTHIASFTAALASWQNFYLLVGTATATLIGLMFIAVTFGAGLVNVENAATARAFLDPTLTHFVQLLLTACLFLIPTMSPALLGALLLVLTALRTLALLRVYRHMQRAQRDNNDIELSDWLLGIVLPLLCHLLLAAAGVGFVANYDAAFTIVAIVTIAVLLNGVYGAWELMVWMALTRPKR